MRKILFLSLLIATLSACSSFTKQNAVSNPSSEPSNRIPELLATLNDSKSNQIIVVSHRGDWRNAPENSLQAIQNCIDMGVDIVELDVHMSKDSVLVIMHDSQLERTSTGKGPIKDYTLAELKTFRLKNGVNHPTHHQIPTLEEAMLCAKGKILINLDKCYSNFDKAYEVLVHTNTVDQVVMKGLVTSAQVQREFADYLDKIIFMPVVKANAESTSQVIADYQQELQPIAYELVYGEENPQLLQTFNKIQDGESRIWVNTLWESLCGGYEDDMAVANPDSIYGHLITNGVNIIQTDRPQLLLEYLRSKGLHD